MGHVATSGRHVRRYKKVVNRYLARHLKTLDEILTMNHDEGTRQGRLRYKGLPMEAKPGYNRPSNRVVGPAVAKAACPGRSSLWRAGPGARGPPTAAARLPHASKMARPDAPTSDRARNEHQTREEVLVQLVTLPRHRGDAYTPVPDCPEHPNNRAQPGGISRLDKQDFAGHSGTSSVPHP